MRQSKQIVTVPKKDSFKKTKLGQLLETFSIEDINSLDLYLQSPFFKISNDEKKIFAFVKDDLTVSKAAIFQEIRPEISTYNGKMLNKAISQLYTQVRNFLSHQQLQNQPLLGRKLLTQAFDERSLFKFFQKEMIAVEKTINKFSFKNYDYYQELFLLNYKIFFHPETNKNQNQVESLTKMCDNLDKAMMLAKLRTGCELLTRNYFWNDQNVPVLLPEVIKHLDADDTTPEEFKLYAQVAHMLEKKEAPTIKEFEKLVDRYEKNIDLFNKFEKAALLQFFINYSNSLLEKGNLLYKEMNFKLVKIGVEKDLYIYEKRMDHLPFSNVVVVACIAKDFAYARNFIKNYQKYLAPETTLATVKLCNIYIYFHEKDYHAADDALKTFQTTIMNYKLRMKSIQIRCDYYFFLEDTSYEKTFNSHSKNFKSFLSRYKSLSEEKKLKYGNMIEALDLLMKAAKKPPVQRKEKLIQLKEKLEKEKTQKSDALNPIIGKAWLLEQIAELEDYN